MPCCKIYSLAAGDCCILFTQHFLCQVTHSTGLVSHHDLMFLACPAQATSLYKEPSLGFSAKLSDFCMCLDQGRGSGQLVLQGTKSHMAPDVMQKKGCAYSAYEPLMICSSLLALAVLAISFYERTQLSRIGSRQG